MPLIMFIHCTTTCYQVRMPKQCTSQCNCAIEFLSRMAVDFKRDVKVATNFWNLLPAAICMMPDIAAGVQSQDCWNGTAKGRLVPQQHLFMSYGWANESGQTFFIQVVLGD